MGLYDTLLEELRNYDIGLFDKAEQERRLAICQQCDKFDEAEHKCAVCKCSVAVRVMMHINCCPDKKWVGTNEENQNG